MSSVQEAQILEHNLQTLLMQRQSIELELAEISNAHAETLSSKGKVYQVINSIMVESEKEKILSVLSEKKRILEMQLSSVEKQQKLLELKMSSFAKANSQH